MLFDLKCKECGHEAEYNTRSDRIQEEVCLKCNEQGTLRIIHKKAPPVQFKGKWHVNGGY